jgi:L-asparaginase
LAALPCLAAATFARAQQLPRVVVLATGGTIASKYDAAAGGLVPALTGADLVQAVPELASLARVEVEQVVNVSSSNMTPDVWLRLSRRMNAALAHLDVSGVVVTHGTDTLEETAYFLDLTVASPKPVILVGAQLAASYYDSDGRRNLLNAVRVAVSPEAVGKGAMVVMNGQINAAREVTKTSTIERETFRTLEFGALGVADMGAVRFYRAPLRRQSIPIDDQTTLGRVEIVMAYAGANGQVLRAVLDDAKSSGKPLAGVVIAGNGLGHVSDDMAAVIQEARTSGLPVVVSTRVYTWRTVPLYATPGGGVSLQKMGCILSDNLSPQKARVLLLLALTRTRDNTALQDFFAK